MVRRRRISHHSRTICTRGWQGDRGGRRNNVKMLLRATTGTVIIGGKRGVKASEMVIDIGGWGCQADCGDTFRMASTIFPVPNVHWSVCSASILKG